jgi:tetratricopeptide (TPR) repeat protein
MSRKQHRKSKPPHRPGNPAARAQNPEAAGNLVRKAYKLHQAGKFREAEAVYKQALQKASNHPDANNLLGLLCIQTQRFELAVKLILRGLSVQPDNPQSHFNLAIAFKDLGCLDDAEKHFRKSLSLAPGNIEAISSLGIILRMQRKPEDAIRCFDEAVHLNPAYAEAHCNLGLAFLDRKELERAEPCLRQALKLKPELAIAHNGLAEVFIAKGQFDEALTCIEKALALNPVFSEAINNRGVILNKKGDAEKAVVDFSRAVEIFPGNDKALMNLGITLEQTGKLQKAADSFKQAIKSRPDFADAHYLLAHLKNHCSSDEEIQDMLALFENKASSSEQRIQLAFGLSYAFESRQKYAESFEYLQKAHHLKRLSLPFDLSQEAHNFQSLEESFDARFFEKQAGAGASDRRPLFIVGMPRSGTSLTEQILASHPQVHGAGEIGFLEGISQKVLEKTGVAYPQGCTLLDNESLQELGHLYMRKLDKLSTSKRFITNTTPTNFLYVGLIAAVLPNAQIINCVRNPMDNCLSIFKQLLTDPHAYSHDLEDLGGYFNLYNKLMNHWRRVLPGRIYDLPYEALVTDSEKEIRELLAFCNLPFDEKCLHFHQTDRVVRTPSASQVRQPLYSDTIELWKRYEKQLGPLQAVLNSGKNSEH